MSATAEDSAEATPSEEAEAPPPPEMAEMEDLGDSPSLEEADRMRFAGRITSIRVLEAADIFAL